MTRCKKCGMLKDEADFYKKAARKNGLQPSCKVCCSLYNKIYNMSTREERKLYKKEYYRSNKNKKRDRDLRNKYGISLTKYEDILAKQAGVCAICGRIERYGRQLAVDHSHSTGGVRGLLCNSCNHILGLSFDNINILQSAIRYLRRDL